MQEVPHSVRGRTHEGTSSLQYQDMNCYLSLAFYCTEWLWVSRLHDEYIYQGNTTIHFEYCRSDRKSLRCVPASIDITHVVCNIYAARLILRVFTYSLVYMCATCDVRSLCHDMANSRCVACDLLIPISSNHWRVQDDITTIAARLQLHCHLECSWGSMWSSSILSQKLWALKTSGSC